MARKNLLLGLVGSKLTAVNLPGPDVLGDPDEVLPSTQIHGGQAHELTAVNSTQSLPFDSRHSTANLGGMRSRGPIGAVTRSIAELKAHAVLDLDPSLIEPSPIADRLTTSSESHNALVASIKEHGQQVPVLVRPHPDTAGRFQIAYGRRRLRAVAELGWRVRAVVKPLTDQELVVAQGQENSARTDLSFIEKALFAARLEEGRYPRETIMAALSVDKTTLSRLISSAIKIPIDLIEAVGPAPKAGRDRWTELAGRFEHANAVRRAREVMASAAFSTKTSDDRFEAVFKAASPKPSRSPTTRFVRTGDGVRLARIKDETRGVTVLLDRQATGEFGAYLIQQLPEIFAAFKRRTDA